MIAVQPAVSRKTGFKHVLYRISVENIFSQTAEKIL